MNKYKVLKELINQWIKRETENYSEAMRLGGGNMPGAYTASGAIDAYKTVLKDIEELEKEAAV
jgi:hypothetical protein